MKRSSRPISAAWLAVALVAAIHGMSPPRPSRAGDGPDAPVDADIVLRGGTRVDRTRANCRAGDVALRGDPMIAVGASEAEGARPLLIPGRWACIERALVNQHATILHAPAQGCASHGLPAVRPRDFTARLGPTLLSCWQTNAHVSGFVRTVLSRLDRDG